MTALTDMVEIEAALAEHELSDDEAEAVKEAVSAGAPIEDAIAAAIAGRELEEEETQPEAPAIEELGEPTPKQLRDLDKENDRHLERVRTIMGGFVAGFEPCGECGSLGLTPPGPRPQSHEYFEACATCNGFGEVKTGSLRPGNESRDCPTCRGRGYLEAIDGNGAPLAEQPPQPAAIEPLTTLAPDTLAPTQPPAQTTERRMGTPAWMGDPNIGR